MSAQTQVVSDLGQLVDVQSVSLTVSEPAANDFDPIHLSASSEDVGFEKEEGDENVPLPGPSSSVAVSDIRRLKHDIFSTVLDRSTKHIAIAPFEDHDDRPLPSVLLEGKNAISPQSHLPTATPLISASSVTRSFDGVSPKDLVETDSGVPIFELPPLVVSPGFRAVSEEDPNDL
ncbi:hypothetical protein BD413DRAFT_579595 [Trametes elegans]|nr:hypothetical protein BD413DRAFT_579595 [Trametes elegans]